jgi:hypothetical protein
MISLLKKDFWFSIVFLGSTSIGLAQSAFFQVDSTPYDRQMTRIQPTLMAPAGYSFERLSFTLINEWMIELRAMPYRYSREWRTPLEVEAARVADCKGKALALYDRMQLNGAANLRVVIGKRRANDSLTHAWLEWETEMGTVLLDPTFNWTAEMKTQDSRSYIPFYGFEGAHKFQAANSLVVKRTIGTRSPAAPAHGAITRPLRTASRMRPSPLLFDQGPVDPRFSFNRPSL